MTTKCRKTCEIEDKYCGLIQIFPWNWRFFYDQAIPASHAVYFSQILGAYRQMTAAARHNSACRRMFSQGGGGSHDIGVKYQTPYLHGHNNTRFVSRIFL